jgi:hypothetical protein
MGEIGTGLDVAARLRMLVIGINMMGQSQIERRKGVGQQSTRSGASRFAIT